VPDAVFAELFARVDAQSRAGARSPLTAACVVVDGEWVAEEVCDGHQGFAAHRLLEREGLPTGASVRLFTTLSPDPVTYGSTLASRGWTMEGAVSWPGQETFKDTPWSERAKALVLGWARGQRTQQPEVTCKVACTLDGHIATASGESQWITGEEARRDGHALRATHDAILIGSETALLDNPSLTCRLEGCPDAHPTPVVVDTRLRLPADALLLAGPRRALVFAGSAAPERDLEADVYRVPVDASGHVHLKEVLAKLSSLGMHRVLIEGGGQIHRAALEAGLVDRVVMYQAPKLLPGGRPWVAGPAVSTLGQGLSLEVQEVTRLGADLRLTLTANRRFADPWTDEP
jgi:diaminohydroxyphosphoribosylaminopyrimidine deaminase/5-amino-6-(5-phosphoribosylamino)uracil reductase